jgi:ABC-type transport system involved in cytochrome bd biosynthesis fused ATPase/permease subunit
MPDAAQWEALKLVHQRRPLWLKTLRANLVLAFFIASALFLWMCLGCGILGAGLALGLEGL